MNTHPFRIPAARSRSSRPRLVCSTLAALALGLAGAGAANAANLVPMFKHQPPTSRGQVPHFPAPRIFITSATVALQNNCSNPRPIFIASITLHNAGGPLAANRGLVSVSDINPGTYQGQSLRLVSAGIAIPAIGMNGNQVVTVPISSLAPYAGEVGTKNLTVHVLPTTYAGKPAFAQPRLRTIVAVVPTGFCGRRGLSSPLRGRPLR